MRNLLFFPFLIICINSFAQDDSIPIKFASTLTEKGKPAGEKISQKIDKDGGRLTSADGRVELIIPQDAVSKKTNFSIQPVTNTLSPGKASAYQLEPSGATFQKPLQIIFHYSSKEDAQIPQLRNIAWQDDNGQWNALDSAVVDTINRTVMGNITHFSTWVFFDYFNLAPTKAKVKVSKQIVLEIVCTYPGGLSENFKADIMKGMKFSSYVDGVRRGNAVVGTVSSVLGGSDFRFVNYTAPATVPDNNPVALSVEASNVTFNRTTYSKLKLVSNITVFDNAYEITVVGHNKENVLRCTITTVDSSTCMLQLNGKKTKLEDIQNMDIKIDIVSCPCNVRELHSGYDLGPVNIVGASKIDVVPANPPQKPFASVTIYFIRNYGVVPGMAVDPCGGNTGTSAPPFPLLALPVALQFEAKDEEQTILKGGDKNNWFEVRVRPIKADEN